MFDSAGLLDPDVTPVTYCIGGIAATGVAHALALAGRDDVAVYDGSLTEWLTDDSLPWSPEMRLADARSVRRRTCA